MISITYNPKKIPKRTTNFHELRHIFIKGNDSKKNHRLLYTDSNETGQVCFAFPLLFFGAIFAIISSFVIK